MPAEKNINEDELFLVLRNMEGQYSIWQSVVKVPRGWDSVFGPSTKDSCLKYVNENWVDMRPLSLKALMCSVSDIK